MNLKNVWGSDDDNILDIIPMVQDVEVDLIFGHKGIQYSTESKHMDCQYWCIKWWHSTQHRQKDELSLRTMVILGDAVKSRYLCHISGIFGGNTGQEEMKAILLVQCITQSTTSVCLV